MERDFDKQPYDVQEKRVCDYLQKISKGMMGCGEDPIGFLIASHNMLRQQARVYGDALRVIEEANTVEYASSLASKALDWDLVRDGE